MTERITKVDVRRTFGALCTVATRVGFETQSWRLEIGNSTYSRPYRLCWWRIDGVAFGGHPLGDVIGMTAREAYNWLCAAIKTLQAVEQLERDREYERDLYEALGDLKT